ncbi:MAG: hypothetical protein OEV64_00630 [Desulfobulbaceae bacterium]|nr:hypothetical protein [Desulfobulbaceae bacterium]
MFFIVINLLVVLLLMFLVSRKFLRNYVDIILAVFTLFWSVAVASGLILSFLDILGNRWAWLACTLLLGGAIFTVTSRMVSSVYSYTSGSGIAICDEVERNSRFDVKVIGCVIFGLFLINLLVALSYPPTNWDANTYHLPRAFFYMSQGNLHHFPTVNFRQTFLTFNPTLLIIWLTVFKLSETLLCLVNPICWVVCVLGVYRLAILSGATRYSALIVAFVGCLAPEIYAQGASTTTDIQQASLILCSAVFAISFIQNNGGRFFAVLSILAFCIATGIKVTGFFFGPIIFIIICFFMYRNGIGKSLSYIADNKYIVIVAVFSLFLFVVPFMIYNYIDAGVLMTPHYDYLRNKPFSFYSWLQAMYTFTVQLFVIPFRFILDEYWLEAVSKHYLFPIWERKYAFNDLQVVIPGISEDSLWYSFSPYFLSMALFNELRRKEYWLRPSFVFFVAAISWFVTYCAVGKWGMYNQRYFISAFLITMPSLAMLCDVIYGSRKNCAKVARFGLRIFMLFLLVQAGVCLRYNYYRPVMPIIKNGNPSAALDILPHGMKEVLGGRENVNIVQYSWEHQDERHYPYVRVMPTARYTLKQYRMEQVPDVKPQPLGGFNLLSFWGTTEGNLFATIPASLGWLIVPVEKKKTPGVVYLGAIGQWYIDYFKYFSFESLDRACRPGEENILFVALHDRNNSIDSDGKTVNRFIKLRLATVGLSEKDELDFVAIATLKDGTRRVVWEADRDGYIDLMLPSECTELFVELKDERGQSVGRGRIAVVPFTAKIQSHDLAHIDLVNDPVPEEVVVVNGLAASEGPYTAMGLPRIRWSNAEEVSFCFENKDDFLLDSLLLGLEFKPETEGSIEIIVNSKSIDSLTWSDRVWQAIRVEVPLAEGENEIVIKANLREHSPELLKLKNFLMFRKIQFRGIPSGGQNNKELVR